MQSTIVKCGVIGNPIEHSLSPTIHQSFARQTGIDLIYSKYLLDQTRLQGFVREFFADGGLGLNVTAPFKQTIISTLDRLTPAASVCQSVNTVCQDSSGQLVGDTTDGPGIMLDLTRLEFAISHQRILIVGAGGAAIPICLELLNQQCQIVMLNRTLSKVEDIAQRLVAHGSIEAFAPSNQPFDGIISATSQFNAELLDAALARLKPSGFIYELNYAERAEKTLEHCRKAGFARISDGYGMLIGQAAKSFQIWHHKMPSMNI